MKLWRQDYHRERREARNAAAGIAPKKAGDWGILDLPEDECEAIIRQRLKEFNDRDREKKRQRRGRGHHNSARPNADYAQEIARVGK